MQKNSCASVAWAVETASGSISFTVNPPSSPCAITASSASTPNRLTHMSFFFHENVDQQRDRQHADGGRDHAVPVFPKQVTDHFAERTDRWKAASLPSRVQRRCW